MRDAAQVLELQAARTDPQTSRLPPAALDLVLMPGECALIDMRDPAAAAEFADLCCGLVPLRGGGSRFLGHDWARLPHEHAAALRGHIGRVHSAGAWIGFLGADLNIMLPQLHHTRLPEPALRDAAAELARGFGLPGLPLGRPEHLANADRVRAACVRAFLGEKRLLLLESPVQAQFADLVPALLNALAAVRDRGAAAIWLTRSDFVWTDRSFPATQRLRLTEHGLLPVRHEA